MEKKHQHWNWGASNFQYVQQNHFKVLNGPKNTWDLPLLMVVTASPLLLLAVLGAKNVTDTLHAKFSTCRWTKPVLLTPLPRSFECWYCHTVLERQIWARRRPQLWWCRQWVGYRKSTLPKCETDGSIPLLPSCYLQPGVGQSVFPRRLFSLLSVNKKHGCFLLDVWQEHFMPICLCVCLCVCMINKTPKVLRSSQ